MRARQIDGPLIRNLREEAGVNVSRFAREIEISNSHLSRIERSLINPSPEVTAKIARRLGVTISEITTALSEPVAS